MTDPSAEDRGGSALAALRQEYGDAGLDLPDLAPDPVAMFERWFEEARSAGLHEPNAVVVSSADEEGRPSSRLVLLKALDERGFVFFTNYDSRKGRELDARSDCALLFPWHDLERQVRVEGRAERIDPGESSAYFAQRPRGSQLGAWASAQSAEVASREELDATYAAAEERFAGAGTVDRPEHWGGYRVVPQVVEFWQGRRGRMHDRLVYRRGEGGWEVVRLAP